MTGAIVGWSHGRFGKQDDESVETLIASVAAGALADAGLQPRDIDQIYVGHFNAGFSAQSFPSSLVFNALPGLRFKPATRVENACASGSAAKRGRFVLVVGVEKMTDSSGPEIGRNLLKASYLEEEGATEGGFAGVFAQLTNTYFQRYGDQSEALATIAAKNHRNGCDNPFAQMRKDLGFEFCNTVSEKNPIVAGPLRRMDCSMVSDGAAAVVLADVDAALAMDKAVVFRAAVQVNDFLPMSRRDAIAFDGCQRAWSEAFEQARVNLEDLSFVETHDCFTIAELIEYEAMGLTKRGEGARAVAEGWTERDARLPVNRSGGLKAKGHPIGATGVSMHVLSAMQLTGSAGDMQLPNAELGGIFNMGGVAVANYVSILERLR